MPANLALVLISLGVAVVGLPMTLMGLFVMAVALNGFSEREAIPIFLGFLAIATVGQISIAAIFGSVTLRNRYPQVAMPLLRSIAIPFVVFVIGVPGMATAVYLWPALVSL